MALNLPRRKIPAIESNIPRTHTVTIYKRNGNVYAKDENGDIICQNSPTSCLQEAINRVVSWGGGRIFIKNGTYNINSSINIPNGDLNLTIEGESTSAVLKVNNDIDVFNFYVDQSGVAIRYVNIENLKILGDIDNRVGTAFNFDIYTGDNKLRYIAIITIRNVAVHGVKQGIYARLLWMGRFENLEIQYSGVSNPIIYLDSIPGFNSTHDVYFDKLYIEDVNGIPVYATDETYNINICNCYIDPLMQAPYDIYFTNYSARNNIEGCYLSGATQYTIRTGIHNIVKGNRIIDTNGGIEVGWDEATIMGNIIFAKTYGIRVNGRIGSRIIGNEVIGGNTGIYLDWGSNYTEIIGNTIKDVEQHGIHIYHSDHDLISGNQILNPSTSGQYAGIYIRELGRHLIIGNIILGPNMLYSIQEDLADSDIIVNNIVSAPIRTTGASTIVKDNII